MWVMEANLLRSVASGMAPVEHQSAQIDDGVCVPLISVSPPRHGLGNPAVMRVADFQRFRKFHRLLCLFRRISWDARFIRRPTLRWASDQER